MFEVFDFATTGRANPGVQCDSNGREPTLGPIATRNRAIKLLLDRGFVPLGNDPVGLPCYRSPSRAILISVGSYRTLAYADVGGRLQVVAAARTAALVCRVAPPITESLQIPLDNLLVESFPAQQRFPAFV